MDKDKTLQQQLYTLAFMDLSVKNILDSSALFHRPEWLDTLLLLVFFACIGWKMLLQKYSVKALLIIGVFGAISALISFRMVYFFHLFTFCGIVAVRDVDLKKVCRYTSLTKIFMILLHVIPYIIVAIAAPDTIDYIYRNGVRRQYFYIGHPNTFSMYVGWAMLELIYAFYDKLKNVHLILCWLLVFVVYKFTDSNTSLIVMTICVLLFLLERKRPAWTARILAPMARYGFAFCSLFFSAITILFTSMPQALKALYLQLNTFFTGRLIFGSYTYETFGIAWIGNPDIYLSGKAYFEGFWIDSLVYDNAYIFLLVRYGAVFLFIFSIAFIIIGRDSVKNPKHNVENILIIAYTFYAIMENYAINAVLCFPILFIGKRIYENSSD